MDKTFKLIGRRFIDEKALGLSGARHMGIHCYAWCHQIDGGLEDKVDFARAVAAQKTSVVAGIVQCESCRHCRRCCHCRHLHSGAVFNSLRRAVVSRMEYIGRLTHPLTSDDRPEKLRLSHAGSGMGQVN